MGKNISKMHYKRYNKEEICSNNGRFYAKLLYKLITGEIKSFAAFW